MGIGERLMLHRVLNRRSRIAVVRVLAGAVALSFVLATAAEGQQKTPAGEPTTTLKVSTEVVNVLAIVKDKKGRLIPDLNREDFKLREDGEAQEIRYFARETDTPLTLGILIDTSGSEQRMLPLEQQEAKAFIQQVIRPKDLAFVIHFDLFVELLQDLTSETARLERAIDDAEINAGAGGVTSAPFPGASVGGTHLYDAVYLGAHDMLKNEIGRKVLIVLSDGMDEGSKVSMEKALEAAQKADVIIYCIAVADYRYSGGYGTRGGLSNLKKLSQETGGTVLEAGRRKDLSKAFQEIADELRTQYLLGYSSSNTKRDGSFRKIRVDVRDNHLNVQARRGYYAPGE
jgi:VWFA-related protein